jgi:hypothetical protein
MDIKEKLMHIQNELKVPKAQRNEFGNYNFRSCEDIMEAVKPILFKHKCILTLTDNIKNIGDRYYLEAVAKLQDVESDGEIIVTSLAREADDKKGMDLAQITGSSSSYARKYALNGLFSIDDTKDSDYTNKHETPVKVSKNHIETLKGKVTDEKAFNTYIKSHYKANKIEDLTVDQYRQLMKKLNKKEDK